MPGKALSLTSPVLPPSSSAWAPSLLNSHLSIEPSAVLSDFHFTGNSWPTSIWIASRCGWLSVLSK